MGRGFRCVWGKRGELQRTFSADVCTLSVADEDAAASAVTMEQDRLSRMDGVHMSGIKLHR